MIRPALLLLLAATPLAAQGVPVVPGDRIRVHAPASGYDRLTGEVTETTPDLISMKVDGAAGEFYVRREQILLLYKSASRHRNTRKGIAGGAVVGAALGMWFGPKGGERAFDESYTPPVLRNAAIGGLAGALIGAGAGFLKRSDRWVHVPLG
jgi:hypothetical protein